MQYELILPLFMGSGDHNKTISEKKTENNIGLGGQALGKMLGHREFFTGVLNTKLSKQLVLFWLCLINIHVYENKSQ